MKLYIKGLLYRSLELTEVTLEIDPNNDDFSIFHSEIHTFVTVNNDVTIFEKNIEMKVR